MTTIETKLLTVADKYLPRCKLKYFMLYVLKCRALGYGYKRILSVFI